VEILSGVKVLHVCRVGCYCASTACVSCGCCCASNSSRLPSTYRRYRF
jgi:hypothetical protein